MKDDTFIKLEGYIEDITFRNEENGYTVFSVSSKGKETVCVGTVQGVYAGQFAEVSGSYVTHPVYGRQLSVSSLKLKEPHSREAFLRFVTGGAIPGIKKRNGTKIADRFGDDSYRVLLEEPELLAKEIKGISLNKAYEFQRILIENKQFNDVIIFLQGYGIGTALAKNIYKHFGEDIYSIIKENPYRLAEEVSGIGFKTADDIVKRSGLNVSLEYRSRAAVIYTLERAAAEGNTYLPLDTLQKNTEFLLGCVLPDFEMLIADLSIEGKIVARASEDEKARIYIPSFFYMEKNVAGKLVSLNSVPDALFSGEEILRQLERIEEETGLEPDEIQREAVLNAVSAGVAVITGGPGTGKTTVINSIIKIFLTGGLKVKLAAPTGRAAKRMTQACNLEAATIHRLLGYSPAFGDEKDKIAAKEEEGAFEYNEYNHLPADVVIVDEMSMTDIWLMNSLLSALAPGTRLILTGDADQLPSVGAGNVFGDIIESEAFKVIRLEKIFRQAAESDIVSNAHLINKGEKVDLSKKSKDFLFIKRDTDEKIISAIFTLVKEKLPEYVDAPREEIQILTPSRGSRVGVERLNVIMQNLLNPPSPDKREKEYRGTLYREGDKVMQIKNDYNLEWQREDSDGTMRSGTGVFNGDTGIIKKISFFTESVFVLFDDGRQVEYGFDELHELEQAYAVTIHKAQGSEYPAVVIPMYPAPRMLMNRKLLYTAVTRAKKCVCLVGLPESFEQMAGNIYDIKRYSSLSMMIRELLGGI